MNRWRIPIELEREVLERDTHCVYCRICLLETLPEDKSRKAMGSWEHIINDAMIITRENIARCCRSCNSSKGKNPLVDWMRTSDYCKRRDISAETVADIVKQVLKIRV